MVGRWSIIQIKIFKITDYKEIIFMSNNNTALVKDVQVSALDMVLPATLLFLILYFPLSLVVGVRESPLIGTIILLLIWMAFCGVFYGIKFFMSRGNMPIPYIIRFINANVGLNLTNIIIIVLALICGIGCWFTGSPWICAACIATCIGFASNLAAGQMLWELDEMGEGWVPSHSPNFSPNPPPIPQGTKEVKRTFSWNKVLDDKNIAHGDESFEVSFAEPDYTDEKSADFVRTKNPFYSNQPTTEDEYTQFASQVKPGSGNQFETAAISKIIQSAEDLCKKYSLADYEMYDLLLKFCQYNVNYMEDEKSQPIKCIREYYRFPGESLFDKEGDCDCKATLAYGLFKMIGANVELVSVCIADDQNGGKGLNHAAIILKDGKIPFPPSYKKDRFGAQATPIEGVFCDATPEGYDPGEYSPNMVKETVTIC